MNPVLQFLSQLSWSHWGDRRNDEDDSADRLVLRLRPDGVLGAAAVTLLLGGSLLGVALGLADLEDDSRTGEACLLLGGATVCMACVWFRAARRVVVDAVGLRSEPPVGRSRSLAWSDVEAVRCSSSGATFVGRGRRVPVSSRMRGFELLGPWCERHLAVEVFARDLAPQGAFFTRVARNH